MLALAAVLLVVWAVAWVVLVCERGGPAILPAPPAEPAPPHLQGPTFVSVAPGGTVIVASQIAAVSAAMPAQGDPAPTTVRVVPSTRLAAAYGLLPRAGRGPN